MIQRIQTVYLLLAAIGGGASWYWPLWRAKLNNGQVEDFTGASSYLYFMVLMIVVALALVSIFLFRKRKLQFRLTVLNAMLALGSVALLYFKVQDEVQKYTQSGTFSAGKYMPAAILPFVIFVLLILAARGIYKDEKLVKSLDRLR